MIKGIILLAMISLGFWRSEVHAEVPVGHDIMFVIDVTLSMRYNDPHRDILAAVEYVAELSAGTRNRIGFVVFNDTIVAYRNLQELDSANQVDAMMEQLRQIQIARGTDTGLGLQMTRRLLRESNYREGRTAVIILSDGDTEYEIYNPNRSQADVDRDIEDFLTDVGVPVYTIQYRIGGPRYQPPKEAWGERTGGDNYHVASLEQLMDAIEAIFGQIMDLGVEPLEIEDQRLTIPVPETATERAIEIIITLVDNETMQDIRLPQSWEHVDVTTVGNNTIITITNPILDEYYLYYTTIDNEPLAITSSIRMGPHPDLLDEAEEVAIPFWEDPLFFIMSGGVLFIILMLIIRNAFRKSQLRKQYRTFKGALECRFMEIPSGIREIPAQSWSASVIAGKEKTSLYDLLRSVPLRKKMPAAAKVFIAIGENNTISIWNQAGIICYKNGRTVLEDKITLKGGEGIYMVFQKDTIELELTVRQTSLTHK